MRIHILPNWYKKLGLILFIIASLLNGSLNFINNSVNKYKISRTNTFEMGTKSDNGIFRTFK